MTLSGDTLENDKNVADLHQANVCKSKTYKVKELSELIVRHVIYAFI